jgi:hypothetical protein
MDLQDTFKVRGDLIIRKYDENMNIIGEYPHKNLVVLTGRELIASRLFSDTRPGFVVTDAIGNGLEVTYTFAVQPVVPFQEGQQITISGIIPTGYNGTFRVKSATTSTVTVNNAETGLFTTSGVINPLLNGIITTMKIGEGNIAANVNDTSLYIERGSTSLFSSQLDFTEGAAVVYIAFFGPGNGTSSAGAALSEAGLFNDSGRMMCRTVFSPLTKSSLESLEIFWKVTIA